METDIILSMPSSPHYAGELIRVRGLVQGVGFRPAVWHLAGELHLQGEVLNDAAGVLIKVWGEQDRIDALCQRLLANPPPLARIDAIERQPDSQPPAQEGFHIRASQGGAVLTGVVADAATCAACVREIFDPAERRYRYPFANCTHCGPRLSILRSIPYDRSTTSMADFVLCPACQAEYETPADRRFHAQPIACPVCGPQLWLEDSQGQRLTVSDPIEHANAWLAAGKILAIKGIGGFHLVCDASQPTVVDELRRRKQRAAKPFALMARDMAVIRAYCTVNDTEEKLLHDPAAPIVLLRAAQARQWPKQLANGIAPGQNTLGFMLPYSPLHHLLLADWDTPLLMTSGNSSSQPQCSTNAQARTQLAGLADGFLLHDRAIINQLDDSVAQVVAGVPRLLRRARGYAPMPLRLPPGFEAAPELIALGGDWKAAFCLLSHGQAIISQHPGDLEEVRTLEAYRRTLALYADIFRHQPKLRVVDQHPAYLSSQLGRDFCAEDDLELVEVQHHHAHIAACLADNAWPREAGAVLGVALDGLGYGADGTLWGGEWLRLDYRYCQRLARLKPVPLLGGAQAIRQPWRMAYAHLRALGWPRIISEFGQLDSIAYLQRQPLHTLEAMCARGLNVPLSSSCGRLFDAVAALLGICRDSISYEGQAAIELAALADDDPGVYPFTVATGNDVLELDPAPLWQAILLDLRAAVPAATIAARFHNGLATAVAELCGQLAHAQCLTTVALSGGVFQNARLLSTVETALQTRGLRVLSHHQVPANDGGLALGQALIAAARSLPQATSDTNDSPCDN